MSTDTIQNRRGYLLEQTILEPSSIIKTMVRIIKIKSKDSMDEETRTEFTKIVDAVIRMADEVVRE